MTQFEARQEQFKDDLLKFLVGIQIRRVVDRAMFSRIDRGAIELARLLKGQPLVPRSLLNEFRMATKAMRAEAPYVAGGENELITMANRLEFIFDLILMGESPDDRVPGVPRIS